MRGETGDRLFDEYWLDLCTSTGFGFGLRRKNFE